MAVGGNKDAENVLPLREVLRTSDIPNEIEGLIISGVEYDNYSGMIDAEKLYHAMKHALLCPNCGRLGVFCNGFNARPEEFVLNADIDDEDGVAQE
jgi:hypothetical protein